MTAESSSARFARANLLYQQSRHELAMQELHQLLAFEPQHPAAHALLALCLVHRLQFSEAQREAEVAVGQGPDLPFTHYALARVLEERHESAGAAAAIGEAIRLDPTDADYHAMHAQIRFNRREWPLALAAAEMGLQFDPEHVACNNLRAMALVKLGRKAEAGATIDATLTREPDNAITHANRGWTLLEEGQRKRALEHFREAMRLDPTNEWARAGIVEGLKAGNPIYAVMLRYFLWMNRLSGRAQWAVVLGGYFGNKLLSGLAATNPGWRPWILPVQILYLIFVLLTWLADPIFNLILRLNRYGRHALTDRQRQSANWVGLCLLLALLFLGAAAFRDWNSRELLAAAICGGLALPVSSIFKVAAGWPRQVMAGYSGIMAVAGIGGLVLDYLYNPRSGHRQWPMEAASEGLLGLFLLGFIGCFWVVNGLSFVRPRR
ncbi:MAG TPA: tetratricopeptide repeat protein [Candidatus Limnocylindria bacterium]|jgi:tetratricopeptide (TPR) repeat protein|nr:tetratricopeptide repeat protein [Candidatus Limnocylindria bacterium]